MSIGKKDKDHLKSTRACQPSVVSRPSHPRATIPYISGLTTQRKTMPSICIPSRTASLKIPTP